jgi:hypothetical protein
MQNWKATKGKVYFTSPSFGNNLSLFATDFKKVFSVTMNENEFKEQVFLQLSRFAQTPTQTLLKNLEAALIDPKEEEIKCENEILYIKITSKGKIPLIFQYRLKELDHKRSSEIIYLTLTLPMLALSREQEKKLKFVENIIVTQTERLTTYQTMLQLREVNNLPPSKEIPKIKDYKTNLEVEVDGNAISEIVVKSQLFKVKEKVEPVIFKVENPLKREFVVFVAKKEGVTTVKEENVIDDVEQNIINARNKQAQKKKKFG